MTYRECITEFLKRAKSNIALAENSTGLGKRKDERLYYKLACSYLIDAVSAYNELISNMSENNENEEATVDSVEKESADATNDN